MPGAGKIWETPTDSEECRPSQASDVPGRSDAGIASLHPTDTQHLDFRVKTSNQKQPTPRRPRFKTLLMLWLCSTTTTWRPCQHPLRAACFPSGAWTSPPRLTARQTSVRSPLHPLPDIQFPLPPNSEHVPHSTNTRYGTKVRALGISVVPGNASCAR